MGYLLARLAERSTWLGIIAVSTGLGVNIQPEMTEHIITGGVTLGGVLAAITKG